jgi:hypothetical protein
MTTLIKQLELDTKICLLTIQNFSGEYVARVDVEGQVQHVQQLSEADAKHAAHACAFRTAGVPFTLTFEECQTGWAQSATAASE